MKTDTDYGGHSQGKSEGGGGGRGAVVGITFKLGSCSEFNYVLLMEDVMYLSLSISMSISMASCAQWLLALIQDQAYSLGVRGTRILSGTRDVREEDEGGRWCHFCLFIFFV